MYTFLDLLIVVVLALSAVSLIAMVLMFLTKNSKIRRLCLYLVSALGVYTGYVGLQIMSLNSTGRSLLAIAVALVSIGAVVLERLSKGNETRFLRARLLASAALITGILNAFM